MVGRIAAMLGAMLLAFAGCFFAPDRPGNQSGPGDADSDGRDGQRDDAFIGGSGACPSDDMAVMPQACGTWGEEDASVNGGLARASGFLQATLAGAGQRANCRTSAVVNFTNGASISFSQPVTGGQGDISRFTATFDLGGSVTIQAVDSGGGVAMMSATCSGPGGFSNPVAYSSAYRYVKIGLSTPGGETVAAFHSENGDSWSTMGSCSLAGNNLTTATIVFGATSGSATGTRAAAFDDFETCDTLP